MEVKKSLIEGVLKINSSSFPDDRGFFKEIVRISEIEKATGRQFMLKQVNHSRSAKNTLRGIHIAPWNKIVYVVKGKVQVVIVDCRNDSPTFGQHESFILGDEDRSCVFIPANCGNSYLVLSDDADYTYLTDQEWASGIEKNIAWNDPALAIKWELEDEPILSDRDKNNPPFSSLDKCE